MNTSTIEAKRGTGKRLGAILVGFAVALAGTLAFSGGQAQAAPFQMEFENARINLGLGFTGGTTKFLPAPPTIPGQVTNPNFNPANQVVCPTADDPNPANANCPTIFNKDADPALPGSPLPDYNSLRTADFSRPGVNGGLPASFTPIGCGTPVTFGAYAALRADSTAAPGPGRIADLILNPVNQSAAQPGFVINPLPNAGNTPAYYRVLNKGGVVPSTVTSEAQSDLPATGAELKVKSAAGFPKTPTAGSSTVVVGGTEVTYTSRIITPDENTPDTLTGVSGLPATVAKDAVVALKASFVNPFTGSPQVITGPYPTENTLWRPYALNLSTFDATNPGTPLGTPTTLPVGQSPQDLGSGQLVPGTGNPGLNPVQGNTVAGGFCGNPTDATAAGDVGVGGNVVLDQDDFDFPIGVLDVDSTGLGAGVFAPVTLKADENLIGRFDSATGALTVSGEMSARVLLGLQFNPLGAYCNVKLGNMTLTTGPSAPKASGFLGLPFSTGETSVAKLEGAGALTGTWNIKATDVTSVGDDPAGDAIACERTALLGAGGGGVWLSTEAENPPAYPNAKFALKMKANKKAVKRGGKVSVKVTASNSGIVVGNANVKLKKSGKPKAKVARSVNLGEVAAKGSKARNVTIKVNKKAKKGKVTVTGTLAGKKAKVTFRVK